MKRLRKKFRSGQTALEYAMVMIVIAIPMAAAVRSFLADSSEGKKDNAIRRVVKDSYGDEKRMGTIGRPYP